MLAVGLLMRDLLTIPDGFTEDIDQTTPNVEL
jgi:hypothetical protein